MGVERLRLDAQGILLQDPLGELRRIELERDVVDRLAKVLPEPWADLRRQQPGLEPFVGPRGQLGCRLDLAVEDTDCLSRPVRIYYGIEPRCNLACDFCGPRDFHDGFSPASGSREDFLLREIAASGAFQLQLTGGEIGLRGFELLPVVQRTKELGLALILSTNGVWSCIDDPRAFAEELAKCGHVIQAKISIDGNRAFHDSRRGAGAYDAAVATLAILADCGLRPRISSIIFRSSCNEEQLRHLVGLARDFGAGFQPIPFRPMGKGAHRDREMPTPQELHDYTLAATRLRQEWSVPLTMNFDVFDNTVGVPHLDLDRPLSCGAGLWGVHITHTGEVYPCGFVQETVAPRALLAGEITEENGLLDIWLNSDVLRAVRHAGKTEQCRECSHYGRGCWGGCWVVSWNATGVLDGMDPCCFLGRGGA